MPLYVTLVLNATPPGMALSIASFKPHCGSESFEAQFVVAVTINVTDAMSCNFTAGTHRTTLQRQRRNFESLIRSLSSVPMPGPG